MTMKLKLGVLALVAMLAMVPYVALNAQNSPQAGTNPVQSTQSLYFTTAQSATAAVNNQTTLTIAAPAAGLYNYICSLSFTASQDGTATANVNAVTTSTNFNSFALKFSLAATANTQFTKDFVWGTPATGCVKSASAATATTFVSPAAAANTAYTWYATFFTAP